MLASKMNEALKAMIAEHGDQVVMKETTSYFLPIDRIETGKNYGIQTADPAIASRLFFVVKT